MDDKARALRETAEQATARVEQRVVDEQRAYEGDEDRPLGSYAVTMSVYAAVVGLLALLLRLSGRQLPERLEGRDLALLGVATHRLSRTLAKDTVTSPLRAPFTEYAGVTGPAELAEQARGSGVRKAVGELISCPFCLAQWIATAFAFGLVVAPRATRFVASLFGLVAIADALQFVYAWLQQQAED